MSSRTEGNGAHNSAKGKGRSQRGGRRGGSGAGPSKVRRAADYTPVQEPRADQTTIGEAARLALEKANEEQQKRQKELSSNPQEDQEEPESCYICAEPVKYFVLGTCSHRTCHVCSLRLRALYKKKECTFCKIDLPTLICTTNPILPFQDFPPDAFPYSDAKLGISFESSEMMEDTLALLRFNCPQLDCDYLGTGWLDLKKHARAVHNLVFCDLCTKNKKIFTHEHSLYTPHALTVHIREGDPAPTSSEDPENTGFTGHPSCEFCRTTFYDSDQLFIHCRDKHEQCFICIRNGTGRYQYYIDYPHLETHFQANHYLCLNPVCLEQRFIVFETEIDLQAHQLSEHGATTGKANRRVETNFTYAHPSHDPRAGGGVQMQPNRRRPPQSDISSLNPQTNATNSASLPPSVDTVPSTAINGVLNSRGRVVPGLQRGGFNTSLSDNSATTSRRSEKAPVRDSSQMDETVTGVQQTDPVMAARHASLLTRVSEAVNGSESRLSAYRAAVRAYRASETSPEDMIKTVYALLDNQTDTTARVITSTADLLDNPEKRNELASAWGEYQLGLLQSADSFPSLVPTAPMSQGVSISGPSAARMRPSAQQRKTLSNTAKQSNSAVWARVEQAAANRNVGAVPGLTRQAQPAKEKFPALASNASRANAVSSSAIRGATPWASTRQAAVPPASTYFPVASSASSSLLPTPARSPAFGRPAGSQTSASSSDFPSLPTTSAVQARAAQKAVLFGKTATPPASSWGTASPPALDAVNQSLLDLQVGGDSSAGNGGKKKKKGKQVLLHYGL